MTYSCYWHCKYWAQRLESGLCHTWLIFESKSCQDNESIQSLVRQNLWKERALHRSYFMPPPNRQGHCRTLLIAVLIGELLPCFGVDVCLCPGGCLDFKWFRNKWTLEIIIEYWVVFVLNLKGHTHDQTWRRGILLGTLWCIGNEPQKKACLTEMFFFFRLP